MEPALQTGKTDGDRTRNAILQAAEALFVEFGFAATSMATVAKRANVTKSLIHHHFGSKRELWDAVKVAVMEDYGKQQERLVTERAPDRSLIEDSFVVYFRFLQRHPHVVRLWNWMAIESDQQCADLNRDISLAGVSMLRKAQELGHVRADIAPEYILAQFFTLVRGWFMERAAMRCELLAETSEDACDEHYLRTTLKVFLAGLAPH